MEFMRKLVNRMAKKKTEETISFPQRYRIVAADLSLKRPGFCKMIVSTDEQGQPRFSDIQCSNVNNKTAAKPHGELLDDVLRAMAFFFPDKDDEIPTFYVCEKAALGTMPLAMIGQAKMRGMMDWVIWRLGHTWYEVAPNAVKKLITGSGKAEKMYVQDCLDDYLGDIPYACDDESDAAAVGIAWLIQQGQVKQLHEPEPEIKQSKKKKTEESAKDA